MRQKLSCWLIFTLILALGYSQSAQLSPTAKISVITCGAGDELYSSFGHSAFRVQDPSQGLDLVYNYGTFNFNTPNFYLKFARGKLMYSLSRQRFENFLYTYQLENRWVKEQILDLETRDINAIFQFLERNYQPENRDYKYDFIRENCSTKIPDVLREVLGDALEYKPDHLEDQLTFRELIQSYLSWNSWSSLGIDLALGSVIDKKAIGDEYMFLPDYVLMQMNNSSLSSNPLVQRQRTVLDLSNGRATLLFTSSPLFWFLLLFVFTLTITIIDFRNHTRSRWLDFILMFLTGFCGLFIIFLWFFTDHTTTANNFNIAWAFPANIVLAFLMARKGDLPTWVPKYYRFVLYFLLVVPIFWVLGIQGFPSLVVITLLTLGLRYLYLNYYFKIKAD